MLDQHLVNVSSATNHVINLVTVPLGKWYTWLREKKRKRTKFFTTDRLGEEVEDYEDDDEGQNYVVRKLMLMHKQKENTQRHQLFQTRCTINNKLFELIIDSGSFENIISREVMRVLKLPIEKHPY